MGERLQKILARSGLGSRRLMEEWIKEGRVSVEGKIAKLGDKVSPGDVVRVDGKIVKLSEAAEIAPRVLLYNKPEGELCSTSSSDGKPTVFERLPRIGKGRWIMVGRLDINTMGLLLFTNDGEMAHRLMHPSFEIVREYAVRVFGEVSDDVITQLKAGVNLEDGIAHFDSVRSAGGEGINRWYHVTLREGRNREVRRLWESFGLKVSRLTRVAYGPMTMPRTLKQGVWTELGEADINQLRKAVDLPPYQFKYNKKLAEKRDRQKKKPKFNRFKKS